MNLKMKQKIYDDAVIGYGGADFDIIVGYQPQQQHLLK